MENYKDYRAFQERTLKSISDLENKIQPFLKSEVTGMSYVELAILLNKTAKMRIRREEREFLQDHVWKLMNKKIALARSNQYSIYDDSCDYIAPKNIENCLYSCV